MPLAPPAEGESYPTLEHLIRSVNHHAGPEGYAVVTARTKNSKLGVKRKAWLRCDRGGKSSGPRGKIRIHAASRRINCPFSLIAMRHEERWAFRVINPEHTHDPTPPETHPALRRLALAEKKQNELSSPSTNMEMVNPEEILPTSDMHPADKHMDSESYTATANMKPDLYRPEPVHTRSIADDDLLGQLEQALDAQLQSELQPVHGADGENPERNHDKEPDGDKATDLNMDMNVDTAVDKDEDGRRGTEDKTDAAKTRRRVKREKRKPSRRSREAQI